jgi:hypothetical protein
VGGVDRHERTLDVGEWLERAHTPAGPGDQVRAAFAAEIDGGPATGLQAEPDAGGRVAMRQRWVRVVATPI